MRVIRKARQAVRNTGMTRRTLLRLVGGGALAASFSLARNRSAVAAENAGEQGDGIFWRPAKMDVVTAIHSRRTHRDFTGEPIPREDLQTILACGMAAPSAKNLRPWEFVVLTKPESLRKIPQSIPLTGYATKAGAAVLVCVDTRDRPGQHLAFVSTALCVQNMMLATSGLGYGCVWIELYPHEDYIKAWQTLANLPAHMVPMCLLVIGKPTTPLPPVNHMDPGKIHYESW